MGDMDEFGFRSDPADGAPPHSIEAEMSCLGAIILAGGKWSTDSQYAAEALTILSGVESFYLPKHQTIYRACMELFHDLDGIDSTLLVAKVTSWNVLDQIGGIDYLIAMMESVPVAINAPRYARVVEGLSTRRKILNAGHRAIKEAVEGPESTQEVAELCMELMSEACTTNKANNVKTRTQLVREAADDMIAHRVVPGTPTGYNVIDNFTTLNPGELIIVGARPGMGKSALIQNIGEKLAFNGVNSVIYTLEQSHRVYANRSLARAIEVDSMELERFKPNDERSEQLRNAVTRSEQSPGELYIEDVDELTIPQWQTGIRYHVRKHKVRVAIVDYIQLMTPPEKIRERHLQLGAFARSLLQEAKRLGITVIAASQLRRPQPGAKVKPPDLADLRESGNLEEFANAVWLLHRGIYYTKHETPDYKPSCYYPADLIIAKNKSGPTGIAKLNFQETTTTFREHNSAEWYGDQLFGGSK